MRSLKIVILGLIILFGINLSFSNITVASANTYYLWDNGAKQDYTGPLGVYLMGTESSDYTTEFYKYNTYIIESDGTDSVRDISLNKGLLKLTIIGKNQGTGVMQVYSNAACSAEAHMATVVLNNSSVMTESGSYRVDAEVSIPASGIYYLRFLGEYGKEYQLSMCQMDSANRVLEEGSTVLSYTNRNLEPTYYQINMLVNGYVTVEPTFYVNGIEVSKTSTTDNQYIDMCLVDSNFNEMTTDEYIGESSKAMATLQKYAIDKGTYYLRVSADASRVYSLNMAQTAWKLQAGKKKSRRKLKHNTWYKSYMDYPMKTTTYDYYYFTLSKKSTVKLTLSGSCGSGLLRGTITSANVGGKYNEVTLKGINKSKTWRVHTKKMSKLPKGKYYLRIAKDTKTSNGYYKLKIKVS